MCVLVAGAQDTGEVGTELPPRTLPVTSASIPWPQSCWGCSVLSETVTACRSGEGRRAQGGLSALLTFF